MEQNVFSLRAKLRVCQLFEISTIDQPLFRGWGPPIRGRIVIWLARALGTGQHVIGLEFNKLSRHLHAASSEMVANYA